MRFFPSILLLLSALNTSAKIKPADILYFSQSDSVVCQILGISDKMNATHIKYIDQDGDKIEKSAAEILRFKTSDGELYRSVILEVSGVKNTYICHVITAGYTSLYTTTIDDEPKQVFISINGAEPVYLKKGMEVNILSFLLRDNVKYNQTYIQKAKPGNIKSLSKLVIEYSNETDSLSNNMVVTSWPEDKVEINPGLVFGYEFAPLKVDATNEEYGNDQDFIFGANCEFIFGKRLGVVPTFIYSSHSYHSTMPYSGAPHLTLYEDFYLSRITAELDVKYYLGLRTYRPYISITPLFSFFADIRTEQKAIGEDGFELPLSAYNNDDYKTRGIRFSCGISNSAHKLKPFAELRYSYEIIYPINTRYDQLTLSAIQILLGVSF